MASGWVENIGIIFNECFGDDAPVTTWEDQGTKPVYLIHMLRSLLDG